MAVNARASDDGRTVSIEVGSRFDFSAHREFREAYKDRTGRAIDYHVDLSQTEYIDSSALGMLLLLKEFAEANNGTVILLRPSSEVEKILNLANFQRLFPVRK